MNKQPSFKVWKYLKSSRIFLALLLTLIGSHLPEVNAQEAEQNVPNEGAKVFLPLLVNGADSEEDVFASASRQIMWCANGEKQTILTPTSAAPSPALSAYVRQWAPLTGFNSTTTNRFVAHTFNFSEIAPHHLTSAFVTARVRPLPEQPANDTVKLNFIGGTGNGWSAHFGSGNWSDNIRPNEWTTANYPNLFSLNLNLNSLGLLGHMQQNGFLDYYSEDDTLVSTLSLILCSKGDTPTPPPPSATCQGHQATIIGTNGDDLLEGTSGNDVIVGLGGNDRIFGRWGDDIICGGEGDDAIEGDDGNDKIYGEGGNDRLKGGWKQDIIDGGLGDDLIEGNDNKDLLHGGPGNDTILGGGDKDTLYGEDGNDTLNGEDRSDYLNGGPGNDTILGGGDKDTLYGEDGNDTLDGGSGSDYLNGGPGNDNCNGGSGSDTLHECNP